MRGLWLITLATLLNYIVLVGVGMTQLVPLTDGLQPLDLRIAGYSHADVMAYVATLDRQAISLLNILRWIDTSFPLLFSLAMIGWGRRWAQNFPLHTRALVVLLPLAYFVADMVENSLVARIFTKAMPSVELVQMASTVTVLKFVAVGLALLLLAGLGYRAATRKG